MGLQPFIMRRMIYWFKILPALLMPTTIVAALLLASLLFKDGNGRGGLDLAGGTLLVVLAVSEPFSEFSARLNLDQRDSVSLGQSLFYINN